MRGIASVAAALAWAVSAPAAHAGEDDRAFSVSLGGARLSLSDSVTAYGGAVGADYERGLSDAVSLWVAAGGGVYHDDGPAYSGQAAVGFTYLFDVLKYVPYAHVGIGGLVTGGSSLDTEIEPVIAVGAGVDILRSREFSWGLQARHLASITGENAASTLAARVTWRWGFF